MYDPIAISNFFLDLGRSEGIEIDPLKLQKLLFVAHGWHLAVQGRPLVREPFGAWKWGPIVESVYHEFKRFGDIPITEKGTRPYKRAQDQVAYYEPQLSDHDDYLKKFLTWVWTGYGRYTGLQLSSITHKAGSPWSQAADLGLTLIPEGVTKEYYRERLKELKARAAEPAKQPV